MTSLKLTSYERKWLIRIINTTLDARVYQRALILLGRDRGKKVTTLCDELSVSRDVVYYWLRIFRRRRLVVPWPRILMDKPGRGRPSLWTPKLQRALRSILKHRPDEYGYFAVSWTVELLRRHLKSITGIEVSDTSVRRGLHKLNFVWKRPRYKLITDPELEKKKTNSEGNTRVLTPICRIV